MRAARIALEADLAANRNMLARAVVVTFRVGQLAHEVPRTLGFFLRVLHRVMTLLFAVPQGCELAPGAKIGPGVRLPHGGNGIVISMYAQIGARVTIFHQVTIGNNDHHRENFGAPQIGDDVTIYPGAKIIGPITIGARAVIGANAVVTADVAEDDIIGSPRGLSIRREDT